MDKPLEAIASKASEQMGILIQFTVPQPQKKSRVITLADAVAELTKEMKLHPEIIEAIPCPELVVAYLQLSEYEKRYFKAFFKRPAGPIYLAGEGLGDTIRFLEYGGYYDSHQKVYYSTQSRSVEMLARKCRWVNQFLQCFEFYMKKDKQETFNNHYISHNPSLRERYGTMGYNLIQNVRLHFGNDGMDYIARLAAQRKPLINCYYISPADIRRRIRSI